MQDHMSDQTHFVHLVTYWRNWALVSHLFSNLSPTSLLRMSRFAPLNFSLPAAIFKPSNCLSLICLAVDSLLEASWGRCVSLVSARTFLDPQRGRSYMWKTVCHRVEGNRCHRSYSSIPGVHAWNSAHAAGFLQRILGSWRLIAVAAF